MNVTDSSNIEKVIVCDCDCPAMLINWLKISKPLNFISLVLSGTGVCKPEWICIGRGKILRGGSDTIRFTIDWRGFRCRWFDETSRYTCMNLFTAMWVLVLMTPRRTCSLLPFWGINVCRTVNVVRTVYSKVATLSTLVTTSLPLMWGKLFSMLLFVFYSRRGMRTGGVGGSAFGEEGFLIGHL